MEFQSFDKFTELLAESKIFESGGAFDGLDKIPAEYQKPTFDELNKQFIKPVLKLGKDDMGVLGSTFKKKPGQSSGDLDIALN